MPVSMSRRVFLNSDAAVTMRTELLEMVENPAFNTGVAPEVKAAFIEKHLNYISRFSYIDPLQYVKNLKMKSRI